MKHGILTITLQDLGGTLIHDVSDMIKDRWDVNHLSVTVMVECVCLRDLEGTLIHKILGSANHLG